MSLDSSVGAAAHLGNWRVSVGGRVYGPYSTEQMLSFVAEGRIASHSIVAAGDHGPWVSASDDPVLAGMLNRPAAAPSIQGPSHSVTPAESIITTDAQSQGTNYIVFADIKSRSGYNFERELTKLGPNYRLNTTLWLLNSDFPVGQVRNVLIQHLGRTDSLLVADTTHGKTAWFNLGPEAEAKIRRIWKRAVS